MKKIGDKLYEVRGVINYERAKQTFVDDNGIEWFRYTEPFHEVKIVEHTITGIVTTTVEGESNELYPFKKQVEYLAKKAIFREPLLENVFTSLVEAQKYLDSLK